MVVFLLLGCRIIRVYQGAYAFPASEGGSSLLTRLLVAHIHPAILVLLPKLTSAPTKLHTGCIAFLGSGVCLAIRASVDALCRDETGQISRDPRKNCLKTRRECLTRPSKLTKSHSRASIQLSTCRKASYVAPVLCARILSHAISTNSCHHHNILLILLLQ